MLNSSFLLAVVVALISRAVFAIHDEHHIINHLEELVITDLYNNTMKNVWIELHVDGEDLTCHYIEPVQRNESLPDIVLIHGYGATSALAWRGVIPRIHTHYNVYAIDIPGMGRTEPHSKVLESDDAATTQALICDFFHEIFPMIGIRDPYVVAHSLGAYMFVHCVPRYPELASRMLIADAPGFFPASGGFDYLWASFFVLGIPHAPIQLLGSALGSRIVKWGARVLGLKVDSFYVDYWHRVQSNSMMLAHKLVQKFIDHRLIYAVGVGSPLLALLNFTIPVATMYGEFDIISAPHQGRTIRDLSGIDTHV